MSQRIHKVDKEYLITLTVNVRLKSFSNHDGFLDGQVNMATEEFSEEIGKELLSRLEGEHTTGRMLWTVDYVTYEVDA